MADKKERVQPREVLYEEMIFYRDEATKLGNKIAELLKEEKKARGDLLFQLFKLMMKNKEQLIEIATRLAPYEHAKLSSIEVKSEVQHRYVIKVPDSMPETKDITPEISEDEKKLTELERAALKVAQTDPNKEVNNWFKRIGRPVEPPVVIEQRKDHIERKPDELKTDEERLEEGIEDAKSKLDEIDRYASKRINFYAEELDNRKKVVSILAKRKSEDDDEDIIDRFDQ